MFKSLLIAGLVTLLTWNGFAEQDALPRNLEQLNQSGLQLDLDRIMDRGFIRVLTRNNPACYFMHRGQLMGFEYEMVQRFAQQHGLEVVVIVPDNWADMGSWLKEGRADVIAATVTMTPQRIKNSNDLAFCRRYGEFREQIITRADDHSIRSLEDLKDRTIHVRKSSSYYESLVELKKIKKLQFKFSIVPENMETVEILDRVAKGEFDLTCADRTLLNQSVRLGDQLKPVIKLPRVRGYGWVVRSNQPRLRAAINRFFEAETESASLSTIYDRYFNLAHNTELEDTFTEQRSGQISPYDAIVKKHAATYMLPWTLICSQMYQESRFDKDAVSWSGAQGLMQLMPATSIELGVENPFDPDDNIRGGINYLRKQYRRIPGDLSTVDRMCFALASYNGGYGHLIDARKLAEETGKNPDVWMNNVEKAYALLSEPQYARQAGYGYCRSEHIISYVRKIMSRYVAYNQSTR
ncbi:transglycosylase SLT domain-containing protein [Pontiella agarivorans]|uniref:Transporter substrate-binding domain-containing protein n=1 Tax=Pontiella agarivorans TaxID=3038953 RepID=A0ABU5MZV0_9BACT|nr:transporter substrate-binding domain-containing protein [Pontiella agarivorans]MDZ8119702.1 transporter substrate-binding domain-containing protein [Pontiella agarivorans]